jgi:hypothetical protein
MSNRTFGPSRWMKTLASDGAHRWTDQTPSPSQAAALFDPGHAANACVAVGGESGPATEPISSEPATAPSLINSRSELPPEFAIRNAYCTVLHALGTGDPIVSSGSFHSMRRHSLPSMCLSLISHHKIYCHFFELLTRYPATIAFSAHLRRTFFQRHPI